MLAFGMWTVHVAFEAFLDTENVVLLQGPELGKVKFTTLVGIGIVTLKRMVGCGHPADAASLGRAYPLEGTVPSIEIAYGRLEDHSGSDTIEDVATNDTDVTAVSLEYGA
jgi:hypothetical protein